jgi:hypothetical protein
MIRAPLGDQTYWAEWSEHRKERLKEEWRRLQQPSANPTYRPQYAFDTAMGGHLRYLLTCYSKGDSVHFLAEHFLGVLDAWELSNRLAEQVCSENKVASCRDWSFNLSNLNHYNWCFWLIGLALSLDIPDEQWQRLLALVEGEGEDVLLDRVIASRQLSRQVGAELLHPKPYGRLLAAINAPKGQQALLLKDFVAHWYEKLKRPGNQELWWYIYGDPEKHPLEGGSYFGRWCIEAVAAVKAFGIDDSLCLGHEHYPGDLLRPDGPTTHPAHHEPAKGWLGRLIGRSSGTSTSQRAT